MSKPVRYINILPIDNFEEGDTVYVTGTQGNEITFSYNLEQAYENIFTKRKIVLTKHFSLVNTLFTQHFAKVPELIRDCDYLCLNKVLVQSRARHDRVFVEPGEIVRLVTIDNSYCFFRYMGRSHMLHKSDFLFNFVVY